VIRYLLMLFGFLLVLYALREWRRSRPIAAGLLVLALAGIGLVWFPQAADRLAHFLGVGRAADLVFYSYTALSFLMILNLALNQREQHQEITRLARHLAKATVQRGLPGSEENHASGAGRGPGDACDDDPATAQNGSQTLP
jgi:Uncharacterized conserved protein